MTTPRLSCLHKFVAAWLLLAAAGVAQAHTGHAGHAAHSFFAGFAHPWLGWDHLLAMLAVGLWTAQMGGSVAREPVRHLAGGRVIWLLPAIFAASVMAGAMLAYRGGHLPMVEPMILTSLLAFGVLLTACARLPATIAFLLAGLFGVFHGYAHGAEIPQAATAWLYFAGFLFATLCLHACGVLGAQVALSGRRAWALRFAGVGIAASGLGVLVA